MRKDTLMHPSIRLAALAALLVAPAALFAQANVDQSVLERLRQVEQQQRTGLESTEGYLHQTGSGRNLEGYGAWISDTYIDFQDDIHNRFKPDLIKSLDLRDLRLWYTFQIGDKFTGYFRAKTQNYDFTMGSGVAKPDFFQLQPVDLDLGYLEYRIDPLQKVRVGRQFIQVGRGFTLADNLDGVDYRATFTKKLAGWDAEAFWGTTPNREFNIDDSIIGFNHGDTRRDFGFLEANYTHHSGNRYYAYHEFQTDSSATESLTQRAQDFHYNSNYTGVGANIRPNQDLLILTEGGFEGGSTRTDALGGARVDVSAEFFEALGLYTLSQYHNNALVQAEYLWGSGDANRKNVVDSFGGKQDLSKDQNFLYFGRFDTGLALSPRLSNLHILRAGFQESLRMNGPRVHATDPLVGIKFTEYWKEHIAGAISDTLATGNGKHVGDAADMYLAWRIWSDTVLNVQYGHFKPGNAYPEGTRSGTDRYVVSTTLSF